MARLVYGSSSDDFTTINDDVEDTLIIEPNTQLEVYSSGDPEDDELITDLLNMNGEPLPLLISNEFGQIPKFFGPEDLLTPLWVQPVEGGTRVRLSPKSFVEYVTENISEVESELGFVDDLTEVLEALPALETDYDNAESDSDDLLSDLDELESDLDGLSEPPLPGDIVFHAKIVTPQAVPSSSNGEPLDFDEPEIDLFEVWDPGDPDEVVLPAGRYMGWGMAGFQGAGGSSRSTRITVNGSDIPGNASIVSHVSGFSATVTPVIYLEVNGTDIVRLTAAQESGSPVDTGAGSTRGYIVIKYVGPA